ncbi:ligase-associated DNA damage response endonuclease PdeM [Sphingomonas sp. ID0503]|uniref:ligase-associated DNA damage response endonuclease PdeM n=1 Tax=Sphingomonas sp. ID0503 TaxID=3399691 RepID=UPI003AFAB361
MVPFSFAGTDFLASAEGALFWPDRQALIFADLHLEKASFFARAGQMLPPYDSIAVLTAIAAVLAATGAREVWCLGDSFHDAQGCERLAPDAQALLRRLTSATHWTWITGNHDIGAARLADHCGGRVVDEEEVDRLLFRHEADPREPRPELSGHFHPKLRLVQRGRAIVRRCFIASATKLILPSFGALTGGLDATDPAIRGAAGPRARALVPVGQRMLRFPIGPGQVATRCSVPASGGSGC